MFTNRFVIFIIFVLHVYFFVDYAIDVWEGEDNAIFFLAFWGLFLIFWTFKLFPQEKRNVVGKSK